MATEKERKSSREGGAVKTTIRGNCRAATTAPDSSSRLTIQKHTTNPRFAPSEAAGCLCGGNWPAAAADSTGPACSSATYSRCQTDPSSLLSGRLSRLSSLPPFSISNPWLFKQAVWGHGGVNGQQQVTTAEPPPPPTRLQALPSSRPWPGPSVPSSSATSVLLHGHRPRLGAPVPSPKSNGFGSACETPPCGPATTDLFIALTSPTGHIPEGRRPARPSLSPSDIFHGCGHTKVTANGDYAKEAWRPNLLRQHP